MIGGLADPAAHTPATRGTNATNQRINYGLRFTWVLLGISRLSGEPATTVISRRIRCCALVCLPLTLCSVMANPSQSPERYPSHLSSQRRAVRKPRDARRFLAHSFPGNVFEKRLIESYISEHGRDPVTHEELGVDDLLEVKSARVTRPRPPTFTSIPSLLSEFQKEWDAIALETFNLRQQLHQTRQELSTALYQNDAAIRVIARLTQERNEARDVLAKINVQEGPNANGDSMQLDNAGLPAELASEVESTQSM